jgi:pimeloyl-ACP methyl ester carboxylesterase
VTAMVLPFRAVLPSPVPFFAREVRPRVRLPLMEPDSSKPWLTMVTGITNDTSMWDGQIDILKNDFHILRYDLRGQGKSSSTPAPYSIELLCDDLLALWDKLGIKKSH